MLTPGSLLTWGEGHTTRKHSLFLGGEVEGNPFKLCAPGFPCCAGEGSHVQSTELYFQFANIFPGASEIVQWVGLTCSQSEFNPQHPLQSPVV